jgi:flagellar motor switch protein FliN
VDIQGQDQLGHPLDMTQEHVVQSARFAPLAQSKADKATANPIDFLYDVTLQVSVELGRTEMTVREILDMSLGTVIELNKLAGEPVDILVNGKTIARGEVVVIDDMFGVRVIDVLSPYDRINSLR